jgi:3-deoxy-manno-octulosonate cytidylyltransferase (CMP-KDO synthetase)
LTTACIIPARLASTRLPNKMLLQETGKPLFVYAAEAALEAGCFDLIAVATGDREIDEAAECWLPTEVFNVRADGYFATGTDRVAAATRFIETDLRTRFDLVVGLQADEPEIDPGSLRRLVRVMGRERYAPFGTLLGRRPTNRELADRNTVCAVMPDAQTEDPGVEYADYVVDFRRGGGRRDAESDRSKRIHVGAYCWKRSALRMFATEPQSDRERASHLEQARVGWFCLGVIGSGEGGGINTIEDYQRFVARERARAK